MEKQHLNPVTAMIIQSIIITLDTKIAHIKIVRSELFFSGHVLDNFSTSFHEVCEENNFVLSKQLLNCEIRGLTKQLCKFINILSTFV